MGLSTRVQIFAPVGTDVAFRQAVGNDTRLTLPIRTILVTTKVAVKSHQSAGRDDLALASARRGEALLDDLGSRLPRQAPTAVRDLYEEARREMSAIVTEAGHRAISVSGDDRPLDEDVDVRAKLSSELD